MKTRLAATLITVMALFLLATPMWAQDLGQQEKLFNYITDQDPYRNWATWSGEIERLDGSNHHGAAVKKYVNDIAYKALTGGARSMPYGSIIVQENYSAWGLTSITVMHKVTKGYNPRANDWAFGMFSVNGTPMAGGRGESCLRCHKAEGNTDMLLSAFPGEYGRTGMVVSSVSSSRAN